VDRGSIPRISTIGHYRAVATGLITAVWRRRLCVAASTAFITWSHAVREHNTAGEENDGDGQVTLMKKSRSSRRSLLGKYVPPAPVEPVTVERAIEEGLMIARSALVMDVKNHLIVAAIREDAGYDDPGIADFVRQETLKLAAEHRGYAERTTKWATTASTARGPQIDVHDYRFDDVTALAHRGATYAGMSEQLTSLANDDEYVAGIVESARSRAWLEIARVIQSTLERLASISSDPEYEAMKKSRLKQFRMLDLAPLLESAVPEY
jgi:hypothetical protein